MIKMYVVLYGTGGELDRVMLNSDTTERRQKEIHAVIADWVLHVGDTIKIEEA